MKNIYSNRSVSYPIQKNLYQVLRKKFWLSAILLLIIANGSYPQNNSQRALFIKRYEIGGSGLDSMMEYSSAIFEYSEHFPTSSLDIRLCSKKPFPLAIATAAIEPLTLARYLSRYPVATKNIFVSRSESCLGRIDTNTATELWMVPAGYQFPEAKERIKVCHISFQEFKSHLDEAQGIRIGTYNHVLAVKRLIRELKANPEATGVVFGYYLQAPTKQVKKKLLQAQRLLKRSGLPANSYFVQPLYWTGFPEIENQLGYLSVGIVRIAKDCKSLGESNEILWLDR